MNFFIKGYDHTLFVVCRSNVWVVVYIGAKGVCKVSAHRFYDCIACTTVPFVGPGVQVHHCISLSICYHHYLYIFICTFLPEPPALISRADSSLKNLYSASLLRVLLVATLRGAPTYLIYFFIHFLSTKSYVSFSLTAPIVTTGLNSFLSLTFL